MHIDEWRLLKSIHWNQSCDQKPKSIWCFFCIFISSDWISHHNMYPMHQWLFKLWTIENHIALFQGNPRAFTMPNLLVNKIFWPNSGPLQQSNTGVLNCCRYILEFWTSQMSNHFMYPQRIWLLKQVYRQWGYPFRLWCFSCNNTERTGLDDLNLSWVYKWILDDQQSWYGNKTTITAVFWNTESQKRSSQERKIWEWCHSLWIYWWSLWE